MDSIWFPRLQNIGSAVGFFYAPYVPVHGPKGTFTQLIVVGVFGIVGAILFLLIGN